MLTQAHIFYGGVVQGVGFRFTVRRLAEDMDLCGWVKNLPDGRVELLVEGDQTEIEQLTLNIEKYFGDNIRQKNINYNPANGHYKEFRIVF